MKVRIKPEVITRALERAPSTSKAVWHIHAYALTLAGIWPRKVAAFKGYVQCNKKTWLEICRRFIDRENQLNAGKDIRNQVMAGGAWLNWGFSCREPDCESLRDWEVQLPELEFKS